ncbi:hypothetical protein B0H17DRAFT_196399 [Mycena rosella]|uniref:Uncharacterized protein n=1 Tax=Mycena rosella TaxID=1033263 RepID=A0AAD7G637_MYCRO|nr:hypothetical protein B0H17DRAFT_196399 [Mycena rosella]
MFHPIVLPLFRAITLHYCHPCRPHRTATGPFSPGLAHQHLSPHCPLQSCIVSSPLSLTDHHWFRSHCLLTDPHLTFRFSLSLTCHIPPQ